MLVEVFCWFSVLTGPLFVDSLTAFLQSLLKVAPGDDEMEKKDGTVADISSRELKAAVEDQLSKADQSRL